MANAPAADQAKLLEVQALDTKIHQLAHRRATLPAAGRAGELRTMAQRAKEDLARASAEVSDIGREMAKLEEELAKVAERAARDQSRLDAGIGHAKDLVALQSELASLGRRRVELEDTELEIMERQETAERVQATLQAGLAEIARQEQVAASEVSEQYGQIDGETAGLAADRAELTAGLDAGLLALYERLRVQLGGVGAASLRQGRCEGCRLQLNAVELAEIRTASADQVIRCDECGRILIRTAESGL